MLARAKGAGWRGPGGGREGTCDLIMETIHDNGVGVSVESLVNTTRQDVTAHSTYCVLVCKIIVDHCY